MTKKYCNMQLKNLKDFQFECGTKKFLHAIGKKMKQNLRCEYMWHTFYFYFKIFLFSIFLNLVVSNIWHFFKKLATLLKFTVFKNSKKFQKQLLLSNKNAQKERKNVGQYVAYHYG